jgi:hypothetical protein
VRLRRILPVLLLLLAGPARADDMSAAATAFYNIYLALPRGGGLPDAAGRARYAPLLSPRLNGLIGDAAAAETRFHTRNKDAPPLIEGDLFSSLFEGATSLRLGACAGDAKSGHCSVALHRQDPGQKPADWTDEVELVNTASGWKVDDIAYKAGFAFGNQGLLSQTLKMILATAP